MKYEFIESNSACYSVEKMCAYMQVSKNAFYKWRVAKEEVSVSRKEELKARIRIIYDESYQRYGSPRVTIMLQKQGIKVCASYVSRLMKEMNIRSVLSRKYVVTTDSKHSYPIADNLLNREFTNKELGRVWVSDITYVKVNEDWNYLTTMIDLADRKVVGWSLSEDMTTKNTVIKAWINARGNRAINNELMLHSDRGIQYAAQQTRLIFSFNRNTTQSMSRKGNCWDNAVAESFFKTIKYEALNREKFNSFNELYKAIEKYIEWYNNKRIHSAIGYKTPVEMEQFLLNQKLKKVA